MEFLTGTGSTAPYPHTRREFGPKITGSPDASLGDEVLALLSWPNRPRSARRARITAGVLRREGARRSSQAEEATVCEKTARRLREHQRQIGLQVGAE